MDAVAISCRHNGWIPVWGLTLLLMVSCAQDRPAPLGPEGETEIYLHLVYADSVGQLEESVRPKLLTVDAVRVLLYHVANLPADTEGEGEVRQGNQIEGAGGTGELRVRITWETDEDIDLIVRLPTGEEVYFLNPQTPYGQLDVDDIPLWPEHIDHEGPHAENFFVPEGQTLSGAYRITVLNQGSLNASIWVTVELFDGRQTRRFQQAVEPYDTWEVYTLTPLGKPTRVYQNDYWLTHNANDWEQWPGYFEHHLGSQLEEDTRLHIEGDRAIGTLRVRGGEKFVFVGVFSGDILSYTGEGRVTALPGRINERTIVLTPFVE